MKKLITIILLSIIFIACNDDPVSLDDKKVITDLGEYNIAYSYLIYQENPDIIEMGVKSYNVKSKEILSIADTALANSQIVDDKILISKFSLSNNKMNHYLYNLNTGDSTNPYGNRLEEYNIKRFRNSDKLLLGENAFQDAGPIYTSNLDGSNIRQIVERGSLFRTKMSTINSNKIYFNKYENSKFNSYIVNIDGTNIQLLNIENSLPIDWHPTEDKLLCQKYIEDEDRHELIVYDINKKQIESNFNIGKMRVQNAQYSPDGKKVLIASRDWSVYLYNISDKKLSTVKKSHKSDGGYSSECFSWSPDSRFAIFLNPVNPEEYDFERGKIEIIDTETLTVEETEIPEEAVRAYWYIRPVK